MGQYATIRPNVPLFNWSQKGHYSSKLITIEHKVYLLLSPISLAMHTP